eukprot:6184556-Pleurochrysis_carterae.AAC.2
MNGLHGKCGINRDKEPHLSAHTLYYCLWPPMAIFLAETEVKASADCYLRSMPKTDRNGADRRSIGTLVVIQRFIP